MGPTSVSKRLTRSTSIQVHWIASSTGAVHKSVTLRCVFILVQLNKRVAVCGSVLQRGHNGDGSLSLSILFKYECRVGHLLVLSWAMVRRVAMGSVISE